MDVHFNDKNWAVFSRKEPRHFVNKKRESLNLFVLIMTRSIFVLWELSSMQKL